MLREVNHFILIPPAWLKVKAINTLSISPTFSQFKAPITTADVVVDGEKNTSVLPALTYSYKINEKWAFGAGYYVAAGTKASLAISLFPQLQVRSIFPTWFPI